MKKIYKKNGALVTRHHSVWMRVACDFWLPHGSACVQMLESARSGLICRVLFVIWVMSPFMSCHGGEWIGFGNVVRMAAGPL